MANEEDLEKPQSRVEQFLKNCVDCSCEGLPEPTTRIECYLKRLAELLEEGGGGGGGGGTPTKYIKDVVVNRDGSITLTKKDNTTVTYSAMLSTQLVYTKNDTENKITLNGVTQTFSQIKALCDAPTRFVFLVYGTQLFIPTVVAASGIYFDATYPNNGYVTTHRVFVPSSGNIQYSTIEEEKTANKITAISTEHTAGQKAANYTSEKAVIDYVTTVISAMYSKAEIDTLLSGKQNKTDNSLTTEAKEIPRAIDEVKLTAEEAKDIAESKQTAEIVSELPANPQQLHIYFVGNDTDGYTQYFYDKDGNRAKLGAGEIKLEGYAKENGTYNSMTVGKAVSDANGNNIPETYATKEEVPDVDDFATKEELTEVEEKTAEAMTEKGFGTVIAKSLGIVYDEEKGLKGVLADVLGIPYDVEKSLAQSDYDSKFPVGLIVMSQNEPVTPSGVVATWEQVNPPDTTKMYYLSVNSSAHGSFDGTEKLPNIRGKWTPRWRTPDGNMKTLEGALTTTSADRMAGTSGEASGGVGIELNASNTTGTGRGIYGDNNHVQPPQYKVKVWKRTA